MSAFSLPRIVCLLAAGTAPTWSSLRRCSPPSPSFAGLRAAARRGKEQEMSGQRWRHDPAALACVTPKRHSLDSPPVDSRREPTFENGGGWRRLPGAPNPQRLLFHLILHHQSSVLNKREAKTLLSGGAWGSGRVEPGLSPKGRLPSPPPIVLRSLPPPSTVCLARDCSRLAQKQGLCHQFWPRAGCRSRSWVSRRLALPSPPIQAVDAV